LRRELAPDERESIVRVMAALKSERDAMAGTPLAVLWADLRHKLIGLRDGIEHDVGGLPPGWP
jgi:hypothetical protein